MVRTDNQRMAKLSDPSGWGGLDENNPKSVMKWAKKMGKEMGEDEPLRVKPICAVTFRNEIDFSRIREALENLFGPVEDHSPVFEFTFTRYYEDEMGSGLKKIFFSFNDLMKPEDLAGMKIRTHTVEAEWSEQGKRRVNLDPGYITGGKLVLASTKDFSHRIYLDHGIYGDVQLRFVRGRFLVSEWTYPDYQTELAMTFFKNVRKQFIQQEKEHEQIHSI
jgi:hypothetical protein